MNITPPIYYLH